MSRRQIQKLIFHFDNFVLVFMLVFIWIGINLVVDSNLEKSDLIQHTGKLKSIDSIITKVKDKLFFKEVTKELRLTLDNEANYFTTVTTENFGSITARISLQDSVVIFTKPNVLGFFGIKSNAISALNKDQQQLMKFEDHKQNISGLFILPLVFGVVLLIVYFIRTKRRYIVDIANNP